MMAVVVFFIGIRWLVNSLILFSSQPPYLSLEFVFGLTLTSATNYFIPALFLWSMGVGFSVGAAVVTNVAKSQQQLTPRQLTDEERFGLPKSQRRSARPPQHFEDEQPPLPAAPPRRSARPRPLEDEQFTPQRPQPQRPKVDVNQPPRQKVEKKPRLEPRLYSIRWQGGKAQRAVRKTVIE
jgi:hypothetical protein